jgi:peptidoglycan hydrolase FlgJ
MDELKSIGSGVSLAGTTSIENKLAVATRDSESRDIAKAKDAARQFEALLLHQMFNSMSANVAKDSLLGGGREDEFARDMYNQALADSISKGQGIGIRDILERELVNKVKELTK